MFETLIHTLMVMAIIMLLIACTLLIAALIYVCVQVVKMVYKHYKIGESGHGN